MPKLFFLDVGVEEVALGRVMRLLHHTPGVARVNFHLDDAVKKRGRPSKDEANGERPTHNGDGRKMPKVGDITARDFLLLALAQHKKPLRKPAISEIFISDGRSGKSPPFVLHQLSKAGLVRNKGEGYLVTTKGRNRARAIKEG